MLVNPLDQLDTPALRRELNTLHGRIASATSPRALAESLQRYLAAADRLFVALQPKAAIPRRRGGQGTAAPYSPAAPYIPGGAIVSAAISSLGVMSG